MSHEVEKTLEQRLEEATRWEGATPGLWEKAMELEMGSRRDWRAEILAMFRRPSTILAACLAVALIGVISVALNAPVARPPAPSVSGAAVSSAKAEAPSRTNWSDGGGRREEAKSASLPPASASPEPAAQRDVPPGTERVVIRKATIDIKTTDVRAAFAKAGLLVSEAGGEFVQESSLTGGALVTEDGVRQPFYGSITLRVRVTRLSEVLNKLRELGTVVSEVAGGEDVTSQAVDLEARLRNEHRVEKELLELMESRKDAALKEILELREQIAAVRERIEQMTAQRDRLSHLASLATVLVVIREPNIDSTSSRDDRLGGHFAKQMSSAWKNGLKTLTNTISWLVSVIIGGAIWWTIILVIVVVIIRLLRRPVAGAGPSSTSPKP